MITIRGNQLGKFAFQRFFFEMKQSCRISSSQGSAVININSHHAELVRQALEKHKVVIFSKRRCPYCELAKAQFRKLDVPAHIIELDGRNDANEIQNVLAEVTGRRTVPRCFIDGKFIGGGIAVKQMYELGVLQKYLTTKTVKI